MAKFPFYGQIEWIFARLTSTRHHEAYSDPDVMMGISKVNL